MPHSLPPFSHSLLLSLCIASRINKKGPPPFSLSLALSLFLSLSLPGIRFPRSSIGQKQSHLGHARNDRYGVQILANPKMLKSHLIDFNLQSIGIYLWISSRSTQWPDLWLLTTAFREKISIARNHHNHHNHHDRHDHHHHHSRY